MEQDSGALITIRQIMKFYELCQEPVRQQYRLSRLEILIMSFLHNNPGHDTVGEIADMRMLSKGNVSRGADSLIQRGFLERVPDRVDRRCVHLRTLPQADGLIQDIEAASLVFAQKTFDGFSAEDMETFRELNRRLAENAGRNLEGRSLHGE